MTGPDPRHLLGGVAPDILTPGERDALYAAALKDQALFDALGDEEALRELLADPAVRARLRRELAPRVVPLWRRPALLGVAASLLLAGLATLAVRQSRVEVPRLAPQAPPATDRKVEEAPAAASPAPAQPTPRRAAPKPEARPDVRPAAGSGAPAAAGAAPAPPVEEVLRSEPSAAVEATADRAREKKAEAERRPPVTQDALEDLPRSGVTGALNLAPGVAAAPAAKAARSSEVPLRPTWTLEDLGPAGLRVGVSWPADQHLVLLRRTTAGVERLQPASPEVREGTRVRATFRCPADPRQTLDLYLLPSAPARPEALPAEGPVAGFRVRLHPAGKKS